MKTWYRVQVALIVVVIQLKLKQLEIDRMMEEQQVNSCLQGIKEYNSFWVTSPASTCGCQWGQWYVNSNWWLVHVSGNCSWKLMCLVHRLADLLMGVNVCVVFTLEPNRINSKFMPERALPKTNIWIFCSKHCSQSVMFRHVIVIFSLSLAIVWSPGLPVWRTGSTRTFFFILCPCL